MSQVCVISIYVPNLKEAVDFYSSVLGFEVSKQYGSTIVSLVHVGLPIVLEKSDEVSINSASNPSGVVLGLRTEDIDETVRSLKEHSVDFVVDKPTECPAGKFVSFRDPFGNILEYLQFDT